MACAPAAADREGAVREVAHVYERIKIQQPLLLHHQCSAQLAHSLLGDALRALNVALSVIKQQQQQPSVKAADDPEAAAVARQRGKRRRSSASASSVIEAAAAGKSKSPPPPPPSWVHVTSMPYEDGFQWRKYGEKKINGTSYTRSYFRCTFKDETGCRATKHVQQTGTCSSNSHPQQQQPMFQVTYSNHHTCTTTTTSPPPQNGHAAAAAAAAVVKQEEPPAVLEIPRPAIPFDQPPPRLREPALIPVGMQQFCGGRTTVTTRDDDSHGGGAPSTASSSCISGEYPGDMAARMAAVQADSAGDDDFYDLDELLLLCDSFKDY
ncbi:hypothetical protein BS78_08G018700 [Paspalum vaginatum]|nr:hypothetical protein BS78_08G018700 [Paspalum vaginatum]